MNWTKLAGVWRYRPRALTLFVLLFTAGLLVLANLTYEYQERRRSSYEVGTSFDRTSYFVFDARGGSWGDATASLSNLSNGWPLLWNQYIVGGGYARGVIGWRYSAVRLGINVVLWILMLAVPTAASQWWLLGHQPRLRWSLRGMLAAVGVVALCLGWFVWARDRANEQDALIDDIEKQHGIVWLRRWGPTWLDLVGADRYRRAIATVNLHLSTPLDDEEPDQPTGIKMLERLASSPELEYLFLESVELTPDTAQALGNLPRLRMLSLDVSFLHPGGAEALGEALRRLPRLRVLSIELGRLDNQNAKSGEQCLAAVCQAARLEALRLSNTTIDAGSFARLRALTSLKLLCLDRLACESEISDAAPVLSDLPPLPQLEEVLLQCARPNSGICRKDICDKDMPYLVRLPRLKSLLLANTQVTPAGLRGLAACPSLRELGLYRGPKVSPAVVDSLIGLRQLKELHIDTEWKARKRSNMTFEIVPEVAVGELKATRGALQSLRETHSGIVINGNELAPFWHVREFVPRTLDTRERSFTHDARQLVQKWKAKGSSSNPPGGGFW